ncbi:glycosyltransferase [Leuconostoc pseudomesenteroides]|uniref:glycosyltransferase n=1 Tax=Leuconostoc pseudomesenteroides TaxID=33968 RepID=UPI0015DDDB7E|nr:glycosyltransferase [Leuconostoc pseudomesenteroides]
MNLNTDKVNIITTTIPRRFGGRTKSLLNRARIFEENGIHVRIVTTNQNFEYEKEIYELQNEGLMDSRIEINNIYDYYSNIPSNPKSNWKAFCEQHFGLISKLTTIIEGRTTFYLDEETKRKVFSVRHSDSGAVELIDGYSPDVDSPTLRAYVDSRGIVRKTREYVPNTWKRVTDLYLDYELHPFLKLIYDESGNSRKLWVRDDSILFSDDKAFFTKYYTDLFENGDVVIVDARLLDRSIIDVPLSIRRIFQMHNPHLRDYLDDKSGIRSSFKTMFDRVGSNDSIVSLTKAQRENILTTNPELKENIAVIGHSKADVVLSPESHKNNKHIGIVARLAKQKNIGDALQAFDIFSQSHPEFVLDIYGEGEEEDNLKSIAAQLSSSDQIIFHGFTQHTNEVLQSFDFVINSSIFEGFPLFVIESISNGTPVVSYDVNWGPKEILGGVAGIISDERTPESLAMSMGWLVDNPISRKAVLNRAEHYSESEFFKKWRELMFHPWKKYSDSMSKFKLHPKVSVVFSTYNTGEYIRETLQSLVNQTLSTKEFEVVIVDDLSTDDTVMLAHEFDDKLNLRVIVQEKNSGYPITPRNRALDEARGEFVFLMDHDDLLNEETLERLYTQAKEWHSDVIFGKYVGINGRFVAKSPFKKGNVEDADFLDNRLLNTMTIFKMYRRQMLDTNHIRFNTQFKHGEDHYFVMTSFANARKISILADYDYYYMRKREDGQHLGHSEKYYGASANEIIKKVAFIVDSIRNSWRTDADKDRIIQGYIERSLTEMIKFNEPEERIKSFILPMKNQVLSYLPNGISALNTNVKWIAQYIEAEEGDGLIATERALSTIDANNVSGVKDGHLIAKFNQDGRSVEIDHLAKIVSELYSIEWLNNGNLIIKARADVKLFDAIRTKTFIDFIPRNSIGAPVRILSEDQGKFTLTKDQLNSLATGIYDAWIVVTVDDFEVRDRLGHNRKFLSYSINSHDLDEHKRVAPYGTKRVGNLSIGIDMN